MSFRWYSRLPSTIEIFLYLKAGIANDQLSLALEPEAASLYCRNLSMFIEESKDKGKTISQLKIGEKYIVLDQGGKSSVVSVTV